MRGWALVIAVAAWSWVLQARSPSDIGRCTSFVCTSGALWAVFVAITKRHAAGRGAWNAWDDSMVLTGLAVSARLLAQSLS